MATNNLPPKNTRHKRFDENHSDIDITKEEFSRISDALKNDDFRKLFFDYCEEIQDPANRKKYEEEITQLEAERGVDVTFLNPEPGFVIKTSLNGTRKCFINIAKSDKVDKPTHEISKNPSTGERGLSWSIPLAQSQPRDDIDANKQRCTVFDVIFHSDALHLAKRNKAFYKCLIDTALDAVEREFEVKLDRNNLKYPKMQFKGMARPIVIRRLSKNPKPENVEPHPLDHMYPAKPSSDKGEPVVLQTKYEEAPKPEYTTPKYAIKHRRDVDLAEYTDHYDAKLQMTVPNQLVVEIELPLLKSTSECTLDVTPNTIYLLSDRNGAKYRLKLDLPHTVNEKEGNAAFNTDKRQLCITLPVQKPKPNNTHETMLHLAREDSGVECDSREEINSNSSESPIEELSESSIESESAVNQTESTKNVEKLTPSTFLRKSIHYNFPNKFDCNVLDNVLSLVLHVRNVQQESISVLQLDKCAYLKFASIGGGFVPVYYAFYLQMPDVDNLKIESAEAEAWENNIVFNLTLDKTSENLQSYLAGIDANDLREFTIQEKFQMARSSPRYTGAHRKHGHSKLHSPPSSLEVTVERFDAEHSVEIDIKPRPSTSNTTEEEEDEIGERQDHDVKNKNKKHKKKKENQKKRRSFSESACDDIKAYHEANNAHHSAKRAQRQQHEKSKQKEQKQYQELREKHQQQQEQHDENHANNSELSDDAIVNDDKKPPQLGINEKSSKPTNINGSQQQKLQQQQRKQRSFSECHDSVVSGSADSNNVPSFKSILKRYSRYDRRLSMGDSISSIDDYPSYSGSVDAGISFSKSFDDIPEENLPGLSESCKKTVRFNEVIRKQVFRYDSSILGQRKKNQKRRDRKQRALQRRLSEGDSVDYEDQNNLKPAAALSPSDTESGDHNKVSNHRNNHNQNNGDSSSSSSSSNKNKNNYMKNGNDNHKKTTRTRSHHESESSSDFDANKNSMMFEMEM